MMSGGGIFVRRTAAFVWSSTSTPSRWGAASKTFSLGHTAKTTSARILSLQVRGGSSSSSSSNSHYPSSSSATAATVAQGASESGVDNASSIDQHAQESLSIVGFTVKSASFQETIPYLDTRDCNEFRVLFVLGGPGAGKGTQSDLLKANYPCVHLSAGELLRAETTKEESPHKELIENCLVSGNIVPVEISLSLLEAAMQEAADEHGRRLIFLVDGFPRNFDNLDGWVRCMSHTGVATVWGVLNYQCPLEELERRILNRAKDSGRSDDNLQSARKRFATFERETVPVVDTLRKVEDTLEGNDQPSLHVFDIRGDQTVENVWKDTQEAMNRMISYDVLTAHAQLFDAIQAKNVDLYRKLCANEWFEDSSQSAEQIMTRQEGDAVGPVSNVKLSYISGTKVAVEYDRDVGDGIKVQEKRIWSHRGKDGWQNVHFARLPLQ